MPSTMPALLVTVCLTLGACAEPTTGSLITEEVGNSFKDGSATYAEVTARLGPPKETRDLPNGLKQVEYQYQKSPSRLYAYLIPSLAGYSGVQNQLWLYDFDNHGILAKHSLHTWQSATDW